MPFLETDRRTYHVDGGLPSAAWVWVFATSHTRHNDTSQNHASVQFFGIRKGSVSGRTEQAYPIVTIDHLWRRLPAEQVCENVRSFVAYAREHPERLFFVSDVVRGMPADMAPTVVAAFAGAPLNCSLPRSWQATVEAEEALAPQAEAAPEDTQGVESAAGAGDTSAPASAADDIDDLFAMAAGMAETPAPAEAVGSDEPEPAMP